MTGHRIVIIAFESVQVLDVTGPLEVFSTASRFWPAADYHTELVSPRGGPVQTSSGLTFATGPVAGVDGVLDTLVVAGGRDTDAACADEELLHHVRRLASTARRVTSVCSGAFVLAEAGLLGGRRATTRWAECQQLERDHPHVTVETDVIYVRDGDTWTSAGVTAGIDLGLALVADDHGRQAAAVVARQLVVYLRRSGGQAQYSALLAAQAVDSEPVRDLLAWLPRPPHRRPVGPCPGGEAAPVGTALQPAVSAPSPDDAGRARRSGAAGGRLPAAGCWRPHPPRSSRSPGGAASVPRRQ